MRISFLVNEVFSGWEPTDNRLGGTERGVVEWAEELVKRGHRVAVYRNPRGIPAVGGLRVNGVEYHARHDYKAGDVCVNVKSPEISPIEPTIFYTNDVGADNQDLSVYGAVIHISNWAKNNIPVNNDNIFVVPHGYDETKIYPGKKIPKQCFYASSPDRGLNTLLEAWPKVIAAHPDATLLLTYGVERFFPPEAYSQPGIINLGEVDEDTMSEIYRTSDIWCHPANGGELFCITGIKAQAAGCVPCIIPRMALAETVQFGAFYANEEIFAEGLVELVGDEDRQRIIRGQLSRVEFPTIRHSTDKLLEVIRFVLQ